MDSFYLLTSNQVQQTTRTKKQINRYWVGLSNSSCWAVGQKVIQTDVLVLCEGHAVCYTTPCLCCGWRLKIRNSERWNSSLTLLHNWFESACMYEHRRWHKFWRPHLQNCRSKHARSSAVFVYSWQGVVSGAPQPSSRQPAFCYRQLLNIFDWSVHSPPLNFAL